MFSAPFCSAAEAAAAFCLLSASWPTACVPEPPAAACSADWPVALMFAAVASESTLFVCETSPLSPGLRTLTGMFLLLAPDCFAYDSAVAAWLESAFWPVACVPPAQPHEPLCV